MPALRASATRSNLLAVRQRLDLARQGYELLDRKREVLVSEILRTIDEAEEVQRSVDEQFARAYRVLRQARAVMGTERVRRTAVQRSREVDVRITPRSVMGVVVPSVEATLPEATLGYGFGDTSVLLDQARVEWARALALMGRLSELVTSVWRLAYELRRAQRRVNALQHVFIPQYEETLHWIERTLEEKEREERFRMKRARDALARRRAAENAPAADEDEAVAAPPASRYTPGG